MIKLKRKLPLLMIAVVTPGLIISLPGMYFVSQQKRAGELNAVTLCFFIGIFFSSGPFSIPPPKDQTVPFRFLIDLLFFFIIHNSSFLLHVCGSSPRFCGSFLRVFPPCQRSPSREQCQFPTSKAILDRLLFLFKSLSVYTHRPRFQRDLDLRDDLKELSADLKALDRDIDDTILLVESEIYQTSRLFYKSVKASALEGDKDAERIAKDLSDHYRKKRLNSDDSGETTDSANTGNNPEQAV